MLYILFVVLRFLGFSHSQEWLQAELQWRTQGARAMFWSILHKFNFRGTTLKVESETIMDTLFGMAQQGLVDYYKCENAPMKWPQSWFSKRTMREYLFIPGTGFVHQPERDWEMSSLFESRVRDIRIMIDSFKKALHGPVQFCYWAAVREGCRDLETAYISRCEFGPFFYQDCYVLDSTNAGIQIFGYTLEWYNDEFEGKGFRTYRRK